MTVRRNKHGQPIDANGTIIAEPIPETTEGSQETPAETSSENAEAPATEASAPETTDAAPAEVTEAAADTAAPAAEESAAAPAPEPEPEQQAPEAPEAPPAIEPEVVPEAPVAQEPPATQAAEVSGDISEEEAYLNKIRVEGTDIQKRILGAVETFAQELRPRVEIAPEKGAKVQFEFYRAVLWLLEKDFPEFRAGWNVLLVYFGLYHGVNNASSYTALSEFSTNRFLYAWTRGDEACQAYQNLIALLRATRKKETRKHDIKTINLSAVAPGILSEKALSNLKAFYGV